MNEVRNLLIGIDFGKENTQICCYDRKADEPRSLSVKAGDGSYEIATNLAKRPDSADYMIGISAQQAEEGGTSCVKDLYEVSGKEDKIRIGDEEKEPWELTALFLKGVLRYLGVADPVKNTSALAIAAAELTPSRVENLKKACAHLGFGGKKLILLDYDESFFYYAMTQRKEPVSRSVAWFRFIGNIVEYRRMTVRNDLKPIRVTMDEPVRTDLPAENEARDEAFAIFIQKTLGQEMFSSIQITGEGFDQNVLPRSIRILCFGKRKVYFGNNLYARGACAAAKERTENHNLKNFRFISPSIINNNVGMEMRIMGSPTYHPIIRSGSNWYECESSCELILDDMDELIFEVESPGEPEKKRVAMKLPGLPSRPPRTTRLLLEMKYVSREECRIRVTDLGFGEMFPSSKKVWTETVRW